VIRFRKTSSVVVDLTPPFGVGKGV